MRFVAVRRAMVTGGLALLGVSAGVGLVASPAEGNAPPVDGACLLAPGDNYLPATVTPGGTATVTFAVAPACRRGVELTLASYSAPSGSFDPNTAGQQILVDYVNRVFRPGIYTISVQVPRVAGVGGGDPADCAVLHDNSNGGGANASPGPYDNTCDGSASQNGNGGGGANGQPCAGCVGNADDHNPPGQMPNGSDPNAGYECDRNSGVGRSNPAHTGCVGGGYQVDFAYGSVIVNLGPGGLYNDHGGIIDWVNG
jgi:hypothetical protein